TSRATSTATAAAVARSRGRIERSLRTLAGASTAARGNFAPPALDRSLQIRFPLSVGRLAASLTNQRKGRAEDWTSIVEKRLALVEIARPIDQVLDRRKGFAGRFYRRQLKLPRPPSYSTAPDAPRERAGAYEIWVRTRVASINPERLLADLRRLRKFGAQGAGVVRLALSSIDVESRHWLAQRMSEAGL